MSTILPSFSFRKLTASLVAKQKLTPNFQQAVLKTVSQPIPQPQPSVGGRTTTAPPQTGAVGGTLPKDFPFSTLFDFSEFEQGGKFSTVAKYPFEFDDTYKFPTTKWNYWKVLDYEQKTSYLDMFFKALAKSSDKFYSLIKGKNTPLNKALDVKVKGKTKQTVVIQFQGNFGTHYFNDVGISIKFIKGGLRIKIIHRDKITKQYEGTSTISLPKTVYQSDVVSMAKQILDKALNEIWSNKVTREKLFDVPKVLQTLVARSSVLDDDGALDETVASRLADNAVKPVSDATVDDLDQLPLGTVMNVGDYILAKYESNVEPLYGLIDLNTGNYTDKAFDTFNLKLYAKAKGFNSPVILVDPNQNADIMSIISKYNMLYPSTLLKKLIANFQFKGTNTQAIDPTLTYAVGEEIADLQHIKSVVVPSQQIFIINELGEIYRIKQSSSQVDNKVYPPNSLTALSPKELMAVFQKHTFRWLSFESKDNYSVFSNDPSLVRSYFWTGYTLKKLFGQSQIYANLGGFETDDVVYEGQKSTIIDYMKKQYIWKKQGASMSLTIGGFGQYAILIDKKDDGSPYFMVQYLKNNTSVLRLLVSNQIDWQSFSDNQNGHPTGSKQVDQSLFQGRIAYDPNFAVPTIDDAIEMIVTHIRQTAKTGFAFWEKADISSMPSVTTVVQYYYAGNANNWSIKSVAIPSKIEGIVCGAMLVIPKGVGQEPKIFLVQQNGKWSIPMMNLTVGEEIEGCAMDAMQSIFVELPKDVEFSGASLSSMLKKDKSKVFHTVIFQVSSANANNWTPQIKQGQKITGYAWVDASELEISSSASTLNDVSWKPTILDELADAQDFKERNKQSFQSVIGAWKTHSDQWKQSAPIDPRLERLIDPINIEQMKNFDGLYFDGVQYPFSSPKSSLFQLPNQSDLIPIEQRIAGFDGYKSNPRRNPVRRQKLVGYRRNGLGSVFRYQDKGLNHIVRLNPRRKIELGIHQSVLEQYEPVVQHVLGVKNPSRDLLEKAYALDRAGFALEDAKRNPKDNSVMTLNLDETKAVVQFADFVRLAIGGSEDSPNDNLNAKQKKVQSNILQAIKSRQGDSYSTDGEGIAKINGRSIAQWTRYIPLLRVLGLWRHTLDIGDRVVHRGIGTALSSLLGGKNSFQPNEWSYGQLASMKKHFPSQSSHLTNDLKDPKVLGDAIRLWMEIQTGKHNNTMLIRHDLNNEWHPVPYVPDNKIKLSTTTSVLSQRNNDKSFNPKKVAVPNKAVQNPEYNVEGFWIDMFQYTWDKTTFTGFSSNIVWQFSYGKGQSMLLRSNTRDPRFINKPLLAPVSSQLSFAGEKEVMFVYPDRTPLTLQIIGVAKNNSTTSPSQLITLTSQQRYAWVDARPPYRDEPYPQGKFSDFIKKI